jgi:branched-subunit amino acid aminotransferase/4-amino-4-deoxychorismate lyase
VLAVAEKLGLPWVIDDIPVQLAYDCDEIMFVTTAGGVMPITTLDDRPVGDGQVGPLTRAIWKGYWDSHSDPDFSFPINYY